MDINKAYEILNLKPGASLEEILKARKTCAMVYHPDRYQKNEEARRFAEKRMKEINEACDLLERLIGEETGRKGFSNKKQHKQRESAEKGNREGNESEQEESLHKTVPKDGKEASESKAESHEQFYEAWDKLKTKMQEPGLNVGLCFQEAQKEYPPATVERLRIALALRDHHQLEKNYDSWAFQNYVDDCVRESQGAKPRKSWV